MGPGKLYPGGPTCIFKGKEVPCLCRWTAKGGVDGSILKDIVKTLDDIGIFPEEWNETPVTVGWSC